MPDVSMRRLHGSMPTTTPPAAATPSTIASPARWNSSALSAKYAMAIATTVIPVATTPTRT